MYIVSLIFFRETSLKKDGLLVPGHIRIMGLFIESDELDNLSHVTGNEKTLDFKIAEHINVFQVKTKLSESYFALFCLFFHFSWRNIVSRLYW